MSEKKFEEYMVVFVCAIAALLLLTIVPVIK